VNEHKAEDLFCQDVREAGGLVIKTRSRFQAGFLDLFVKMPGWVGVFLECKYEHPRTNGQYPVPLSELQRRSIAEFQAVGQPAGWLLFTADRSDLRWSLLRVVAGSSYGSIPRQSGPWATRRRGGRFDIQYLLANVTRGE